MTYARISALTCACLLPALGWAQSGSSQTAPTEPAAEDSKNEQATEIASITEDRGIVTRPGRFVIEPAFSHAHSNSTRVAIEGYTVIPALLVGLINISEIQRDIFVTSLTFKYGITSRLETDLRIPWLRINEDLRERQAFEGTPVDTLRESSGQGLGDIEASVRYQLNDGLDGWPYVIGVFRVKAPTGDSPYDVDQRVVEDEDGNVIGIELEERPTGSGFWSFEPGLSFIYPSDPAVLFGSLSYVYTKEKDQGAENGGRINPGDVIRFGFGMGFAFNERTSFSLGYDHSVIQRTGFETNSDVFAATFDHIQVGSLSFGLSQRLNPKTSMSLTVSIGVTENAPSSELTLKLPFTL